MNIRYSTINMQHLKFLNLKTDIQNTALGGSTAQNKMVPDERKKSLLKTPVTKNTKKAAVLALFYPNIHGETCLALTLRAKYKGTHSAQVSLPGGKVEPSDKNLKETALRETFEEIGIEQHKIHVLREITNVYIPPSNFLVTPFIGVIDFHPKFITNPEVDKLIEVPLKNILDEKLVLMDEKKTFYAENIKIPYYNFENHMVWGATAMIISEIKELLKRL